MAPRVVLGPGEVLPVLLYLRDDLEIAALFNRVAGEPWAPEQAERRCKSCLQPVALGTRLLHPGQVSLTVKSTSPSSGWAMWFGQVTISPSLSVFICKLGIIRPISQDCYRD